MSDTEVSRIFIVDDHPLIRQGLRGLVNRVRGLSVAGEAASGHDALDQIETDAPDLVLIDISMPGMDGIECTKRLTRTHSEMKVLIISSHDSIRYVTRALEAGADGYLLKSNADKLIDTAIQEILTGRQYLCPIIEEKRDI